MSPAVASTANSSTMRLRSTTMSTGPRGGAPVPSITVALRMISRSNGPSPSARGGAGLGSVPASWATASVGGAPAARPMLITAPYSQRRAIAFTCILPVNLELYAKSKLHAPDRRQRGDRVERLHRSRFARARPVDIAARRTVRAADSRDPVCIGHRRDEREADLPQLAPVAVQEVREVFDVEGHDATGPAEDRQLLREAQVERRGPRAAMRI